jgi:pentatricopeptide repeat protein
MLKKLNSSTDEEETSKILDNMSQHDIEKMLKSMSDMIDDESTNDDTDLEDDALTPEVMEKIDKTNNEITISDDITSPTTINDELDIILAGFPERRKIKIREICKTSLGKPSMLKLIPVLRENMPEVINPKWLREKNLMDAEYLMQSVEEDNTVDRHILNSMLQVLANSGDTDKAVSFYEEAFLEKNMSPSSHNDRTILQMYLSKKNITQALQFKEKVESQGQRRFDLLSYGLLIEHYGNHGQIGSAIMTLRECIDVHGSPPGEKSVSQLRLKCRQRGIENDVKLEELIGKDPLEWLKEGEGSLKREYSKKGRSQVNVPYNKLVRL